MAAKEFIKPAAPIPQPEPAKVEQYYPPNTAQGVMQNYKQARLNSAAYRLKQIAQRNPEVAAFLKSK